MARFRRVKLKREYEDPKRKTCMFSKQYCKYADFVCKGVFNCRAPSDDKMPCRARIKDKRY